MIKSKIPYLLSFAYCVQVSEDSDHNKYIEKKNLKKSFSILLIFFYYSRIVLKIAHNMQNIKAKREFFDLMIRFLSI